MSKSILTEIDGFTPLPDLLVNRYSLITAAVWGKMWRYCQMKDGVCKAALEKIANELNISRMTVIRHVETLVHDGFLIDTTPNLKNKPHVYADTGKVAMYNKFGISVTVTESYSEKQFTVTESDSQSHTELLEDSKKIENKIDWNQLKKEAKERIAKQRAAKEGKDPLVEFAKMSKEFQPIQEMRERIERAVNLNLEREWDLPKSDWNGYEKTLLEREHETGQTIEQFMEWYNLDEFRRTGNIWLKPNKIEQFWPRAFEDKEPDRNRPEYQLYQPKEQNYVPNPNTARPAILRRKDSID